MWILRFILPVIALMGGVCAQPASANEIRSSISADALPQATRTTLGLYLSPADAAAALEANSSIVFLDVRDPIEIAFVGHPTPIDAIVPYETATHDFDEERGSVRMVPNRDFVVQVERVLARAGLGRSAPIFVMCRSGGRSAAAVNELAAAGYTNVWNLIEGFEGDRDSAGRRTLNGWRNGGLPWTWRITREQAWTR